MQTRLYNIHLQSEGHQKEYEKNQELHSTIPLAPHTERAAQAAATGSTLLLEVHNKEDHVAMETKTEQTSIFNYTYLAK